MKIELDRVNRLAWGGSDVVELFARRSGFITDAEEQMIRRAAEEVADQPILDIGVGGGRTVPLLRSISADYVAIDYLVELVRTTRRRYPDVRVEHMDARDLSAFQEGTFALAVFSSNGIDGVPHADRATVIEELRRVLRPGGLLAYSTHNLDRRPRHPRVALDWRRMIAHPSRALRQAVRAPATVRDYRRLRAMNQRGEGWATLATLAYGAAVAWHYVTPAEALRELRTAGFATVELYGSSGLIAKLERPEAAFPELGARDDVGSLHLVAHKPRRT